MTEFEKLMEQALNAQKAEEVQNVDFVILGRTIDVVVDALKESKLSPAQIITLLSSILLHICQPTCEMVDKCGLHGTIHSLAVPLSETSEMVLELKIRGKS